MIKAVNYGGELSSLLVRLQGKAVPQQTTAALHAITGALQMRLRLSIRMRLALAAVRYSLQKDFAVNLDHMWLPSSSELADRLLLTVDEVPAQRGDFVNLGALPKESRSEIVEGAAPR